MRIVADEIHLQVNGLSYAAQRWRHVDPSDPDKPLRPVLCLHGWLDNSESFAKLAPLLKGCDVLAIDMAGHGETSHRAAHARYDIYDDLEDIGDIADEMGWQQFTLLGHSRGAGIAFLYAAVMPARVDSLVLLDGIVPPPGQESNLVEQLRAHLLERKALRYKTSKPYKTLDLALHKRLQKTMLSIEDGRDLVKRDLIRNDEGFVWRHDRRLHIASAVRLSSQQIQQFFAALQTPTCVIVASGGILQQYGLPDSVAEHPCITLCEHNGNHHFHAEREHVSSIAEIINTWLQKKA